MRQAVSGDAACRAAVLIRETLGAFCEESDLEAMLIAPVDLDVFRNFVL